MRAVLDAAARALRPPSWATLVVSAPYAILCLLAAVAHVSAWFASLAVYYLTLCCLRGYLLLGLRQAATEEDAQVTVRCRKCAWMLIALCVPLAGIVILAVSADAAFSYPGHMVYAFGAYAFGSTGTAVAGLAGSRRHRCPIRVAWGVVSLGSALVSVFALQTALLSRFSMEGIGYRMVMNMATGAGVLIILGAAAVALLLWTTRKASTEGAPVEQI